MSAVPSEAKKVEKVTDYDFKWEGSITDMTSFNAYGVVTLSNKQRVNVQWTLRHGVEVDTAFADAKKFIDFLDRLAVDQSVEFWDGSRKEDKTNGDSKTVKADGTPASTGKKERKWDEPLSQAELPAELSEVTVDVFTQDFDLMKIFPQLDEKVTIEFWKDGLQFAVGAKLNKAKLDTAKQYLATLTDEEIDLTSKPSEKRIAGIQYWTRGNDFIIQQGPKKGQPSFYKNIALLKPAL